MRLNLKEKEKMFTQSFVNYPLNCPAGKSYTLDEKLLIDCGQSLLNLYTTVRPALPDLTLTD